MSDRREVMRECLSRILGQYIQNPVDLDNLTTYLYKMSVIIFKDTDMKEEIKNINGMSAIDEEGFKRALRNISVFTSNKIMLEVLSQTFTQIKNTIPMTTVQEVQNLSAQVRRAPQSRASSEAEFDIDIASIPKVDTAPLFEQQRQMASQQRRVQQPQSISSEFEIGDLDLDAINKTIPGGQGSPIDVPMGFVTDASSMTDSSYSEVPNVKISLDY